MNKVSGRKLVGKQKEKAHIIVTHIPGYEQNLIVNKSGKSYVHAISIIHHSINHYQ